jgi:hypothetical protein
MSILMIIVVLSVIGIAFWLVTSYVPGNAKWIMQIALGILLILFVANLCGLLDFSSVQVGHPLKH